MSLSNFGQLKSALKQWAKRGSLSDAVLTDFVTLTESVFNYGDGANDIAPLRVRDMEATATVTVTGGSGALPADFLEAIKVKDPGSTTRDIKYAPPDWIDENFPTGQDSTYPDFYTIVGSTLYCPITVSLTYYEKIDTITTDDATTNWLLTKAPNAYLYGGLMQYSIYDKNPENVVYYRGLMANALASLGYSDLNSRAGQMTRRSAVPAW
jgi:hypothetical protein